MRKLALWGFAVAVLAFVGCNSAIAASPTYPWPMYSVIPVYFVPRDWDINSAEVQEEAAAIRSALIEVRQLYAHALSGNTFAINDLVVVQGNAVKEGYGIHWNGGDIYKDGITIDNNFEGLLVAELYSRGFPTPPEQDENGYVTLAFVKGAGGFAGSREMQNGDGGLSMLGDWAIDSLQGAVPESLDWWAGHRRQIGAVAHELGHAFGLPHPDARGAANGGEIMGNWWENPAIGFDDWENDVLNRTKLPFFAQCLPPTPLAAPPGVKPYELVMLPTLGADTHALHINELGLISGYSESTPTLPHQVIFNADDGSIADLGAGGGRVAQATSVNDNGVVSGIWETTSGVRHATRSHFDTAQLRWVTEELAPLHPDDIPFACDINNNGLIVGGTREFHGQASIWNGITALGGTFGLESLAIGVNNTGRIVGRVLTERGQRAFVWNDNGNGLAEAGETLDLGVATTLVTAYSEALSVNDQGQVVGSVYDGGLGRRLAFRLTPQNGNYFVDSGKGTNALMTVLPRLGSGLDYALDIDRDGIAVGRSGTCQGGFKFHAVLWQDDKVTDLNDLVTPVDGITLVSAEGINNAGEIVGYATTTAGDRAFLLRPIVPHAPSSSSNPVVSSQAIVLSWQDRSRNESGFEIERRVVVDPAGANPVFAPLITVAPNVMSYADQTVQPSTTYQYRIRAFNGNGASDYYVWPALRTTGGVPPKAVVDNYTVAEDKSLSINAARGLLANDTDPNRGALTVTRMQSSPKHGQLQWTADGAFKYMPEKDYWGTDYFEYVVRSASGGEASAVVSVKVTGSPDLPDARDDHYETAKNTRICIDGNGVLANDQDPDGDLLHAKLHKGARSGHVDLAKTGSFCYRPNNNFHGEDRFTYFAIDPSGRQDEASVTIEVKQ
ncbi:MAG: Ig-like domain-containing protein [Betaproteobacteria bacterium]